MDKSNDWPRRAQNCREQEEAIAETASKLADGPGSNAGKKTWTDATGSALCPRGRRARKLASPQRQLRRGEAG